jgi:predicted nicotinamide N-methyase
VTREDNLASVEASLRRRFRVVDTTVCVADRILSIIHPASAEDLIDERDFERDERLPYWAELWPSARVLAEHILATRGNGRSLLELGCGAGLVTTCASLAGFRVTASDYYEDAVRFARVNSERNGGRAARGLLLDWRALPPKLPRFDVVVASDVLYERPYGTLIARGLASTLRDCGVAIIADPGRVARDEFIRALGPLGLKVSDRSDVQFREEQIRQTIRLLEVRRV